MSLFPSAGVAGFGAGEVLDPLLKGLPPGAGPVTPADIAGWRANVLAGEVGTPVAVLRESALTANVETMRRFCAGAGVSLAPHAKTTMAPPLIARQLAAGAWAMTAALPAQVRQLWAFGVPRVLLANEVSDPAALRWLAEALRGDDRLELIAYVDSAEGVRRAEAAFAAAGGARPLPVLLDLGYRGGRTGVRTIDAALDLASAVLDSPHLALAGTAGYEGTIGSDRTEETLRRVDAHLGALAELTGRLLDLGLLGGAPGPLVSAGGSVFFDRVARVLGPLAGRGVRVVLRSGCYVVHDHGLYERLSPAAGPDWELPPFRSALEVWTRVISRPEPGLALLDAGRRDVSFDAGLPVAVAGRAEDGRALDLATATVTGLSDQHAFLSVPEEHPLAVGDLVGLGVSHPCTTLDRWRLLYLVDDEYTIVGATRTYL